MLKPEQAREALEKFGDPKSKESCLADIAALPKALRATAYALVDRNAEGKAYLQGENSARAEEAAYEHLDTLRSEQRVKIFTALFPPMGRHVEAAWQLKMRAPYQSGYSRKGFRAPHTPAATRSTRKQWLQQLIRTVGAYRAQDVAWHAAWIPHYASWYGDALGTLFAAAIDAGDQEGDEVFTILCDSARGEHEVGAMGRHVSRALLSAARPEGWDFIERLLLAAQRQEGLRQVILETVDEAHPEAFRRMLRLILQHNLVRFSSVLRAVDVWFAQNWDVLTTTPKFVNGVLERVAALLEDPAERTRALASDDLHDAYWSLWTTAFEDAEAAIPAAAQLLNESAVERRFLGVHMLVLIDLPTVRPHLLPMLDDDDPRVVDRALSYFQSHTRYGHYDYQEGQEEELLPPADNELFASLERLLPRVPDTAPPRTEPLFEHWGSSVPTAGEVCNLLIAHLGERPRSRLLDWLPRADGQGRCYIAQRLARQKTWDAATRETLFALVGDPDANVREVTLKVLTRCTLTGDEAARLEGHLTRTAESFRRATLTVLAKQPDDDALASADRLLNGPQPQRLAGLELLRLLIDARRNPEACRTRLEAHRQTRKRLSEPEKKWLDNALNPKRQAETLDDALGLMNPAERTQPIPPQARKVTFVTPAAVALVKALDELVHEHREAKVTVQTYLGEKEELLGNTGWHFPNPNRGQPWDSDPDCLPLREVWEEWWANRPKAQRDRDGLELLRADQILGGDDFEPWNDLGIAPARDAITAGQAVPTLRYPQVVTGVLNWLLRFYPPDGMADHLLDALETGFALIPEPMRRPNPEPRDWYPVWRIRDKSPFLVLLRRARQNRQAFPGSWTEVHSLRLWRLARWFDEPAPGWQRLRPDLGETLSAFTAGHAAEADLIDQLLGERGNDLGIRNFSDLSALTGRNSPHQQLLAANPNLREVVDRCRRRVLEIELDRGDLPTAATAPAQDLRSVEGMDYLLKFIAKLGTSGFKRGSHYNDKGQGATFTDLVKVTYPAQSDTPEAFAPAVKKAGVSRERLIELAFLAPQWAGHVEHALGWEGFTEGVWWFIAHTRDGQAGGNREEWQALVRERTALTEGELREGGIDVAWFWRTYNALGPRRWAALQEGVKYAASGTGHKRALLLSAVLLGKAKRSDLIRDIAQKRARESVRALGLLPLARGDGAERDLLQRYHVLQEYLRYARQLGAMSRDSALRAAEIGMQNLARTAGYADPIRLEWAMEARTTDDLAQGPVTVTAGPVAVTLSLDGLGQPEVTVARGDRPLKNIPPAARQDPRVAALVARKGDLKRQASRCRLSLETAMCRGDTFTGAELQALFNHPVLAPLLQRLVLQGEGILGYPVKGGKGLRDHAGKVEPVKKNETLRIAHPHDLLKSKKWHLWQQDCFAREVVQPFKQVFRELYVLTESEQADGAVSRRYAGHQVNPRQAMALWTSRGWGASEYEGVRRIFHDAGLVASVGFLNDAFTPAEVEAPTVETVSFSNKGDYKPLPLKQIPPRVFSEVMRDMDLVVSVAHVGGVDPEASASTVEMRAALLRETCKLLKVDNIRVQQPHVLVDGQLGNYSVHLGSAGVHKLPGGSLCIVPVHAQHRGRLFLPFADNDPKTAEVLSKVLLLARDAEIQDPGILDQLRR